MKKYYLIIFFLGVSVFLITGQEIIKPEDAEIIARAKDFYLSGKDLSELTKTGLAGDIYDGICVFNYYAYSVFDINKKNEWIEFLAEEDFAFFEWELSRKLINSEEDNNSKIRALYWIFSAEKDGENNAKIFIKKEKLEIESPYPQLGKDIYKKENNKVLDYEIEVLTDYALRGGKQEACFLYEYYKKYKQDEAKVIYWLRIGAQNNSAKCQYEYSKYLLSQNDEYNKIRGRFWIRKAAKNGHKDAKQLAKELGESEYCITLISQEKTFNLSAAELSELTKKALTGDISSGTRIWEYYSFSFFDYDLIDKWESILVENSNDNVYTWNLAYTLLFFFKTKHDFLKIEHNTIRGGYWCIISAENGNKSAGEEVKDRNLSPKSPYPLLDTAFYKEVNDKISDYEIEVLTDYALRGGKKEAYKLYEYYWDYKHDKQEAVYWLRIGAQNKNEQCQYEYGKYLLAKGNENDKIRGLFWIKKAAKNGYEEAEKIVGKLKENEE